MDGKVLSAAFETVGKIETIESWDAVAGDAGTHPPHTQVDAVASSEAMKHLVALGYVAPPGDDIAKAVADTVTELNYNLARAHADAGEWEASASLFAELQAGVESYGRVGFDVVVGTHGDGGLLMRDPVTGQVPAKTET